MELFHRAVDGVGLFLSSFWDTSETLSLYTDASGSTGYGGFSQTRWFWGKWLPHQHLGSTGISNLWQKVFAIVVATCGDTSGHPGASSSIVTI